MWAYIFLIISSLFLLTHQAPTTTTTTTPRPILKSPSKQTDAIRGGKIRPFKRVEFSEEDISHSYDSVQYHEKSLDELVASMMDIWKPKQPKQIHGSREKTAGVYNWKSENAKPHGNVPKVPRKSRLGLNDDRAENKENIANLPNRGRHNKDTENNGRRSPSKRTTRETFANDDQSAGKVRPTKAKDVQELLDDAMEVWNLKELKEKEGLNQEKYVNLPNVPTNDPRRGHSLNNQGDGVSGRRTNEPSPDNDLRRTEDLMDTAMNVWDLNVLKAKEDDSEDEENAGRKGGKFKTTSRGGGGCFGCK